MRNIVSLFQSIAMAVNSISIHCGMHNIFNATFEPIHIQTNKYDKCDAVNTECVNLITHAR